MVNWNHTTCPTHSSSLIFTFTDEIRKKGEGTILHLILTRIYKSHACSTSTVWLERQTWSQWLKAEHVINMPSMCIWTRKRREHTVLVEELALKTVPLCSVVDKNHVMMSLTAIKPWATFKGTVWHSHGKVNMKPALQEESIQCYKTRYFGNRRDWQC